MKKILSVILITMLLAVSAFSVYAAAAQEKARSPSIMGCISPQVKQYVLEKYGDAQSIDALLLKIEQYATDNFSYNYKQAKHQVFQYFDFCDFVNGTTLYSEGKYSGVCFDFSLYVKTCVETVAGEKGWGHIKAYYADLKSLRSAKSNHALNIIVDQKTNRTIIFDVTSDISQKNAGQKPLGPFIYDGDVELYFKTIGYKLRKTI